MTTKDNSSNNFIPELKLAVAVFASVAFSLLIFQSIWLAYVLGLFIVAMKASAETRERVEQLIESRESIEFLAGGAKLGGAMRVTFQWLFAYTALFVFLVLPLVYAIHTKTDFNLLSMDAENFIESISEDGSDRANYAPIDF